MADEVTVTLSVDLKNPSTGAAGALRDSFATGAIKFTQATAGAFSRVVATSTTDTALTLSGITSPGWVMFQNLDATNSIKIGPESSGAIVAMIQLPPKGVAVLPAFASVTFRHQSTAGTPKLLVKVLEA